MKNTPLLTGKVLCQQLWELEGQKKKKTFPPSGHEVHGSGPLGLVLGLGGRCKSFFRLVPSGLDLRFNVPLHVTAHVTSVAPC